MDYFKISYRLMILLLATSLTMIGFIAGIYYNPHPEKTILYNTTVNRYNFTINTSYPLDFCFEENIHWIEYNVTDICENTTSGWVCNTNKKK